MKIFKTLIEQFFESQAAGETQIAYDTQIELMHFLGLDFLEITLFLLAERNYRNGYLL